MSLPESPRNAKRTGVRLSGEEPASQIGGAALRPGQSLRKRRADTRATKLRAVAVHAGYMVLVLGRFLTMVVVVYVERVTTGQAHWPLSGCLAAHLASGTGSRDRLAHGAYCPLAFLVLPADVVSSMFRDTAARSSSHLGACWVYRTGLQTVPAALKLRSLDSRRLDFVWRIRSTETLAEMCRSKLRVAPAVLLLRTRGQVTMQVSITTVAKEVRQRYVLVIATRMECGRVEVQCGSLVRAMCDLGRTTPSTCK